MPNPHGSPPHLHQFPPYLLQPPRTVSHLNLISSAIGNATGPQSEGTQHAPRRAPAPCLLCSASLLLFSLLSQSSCPVWRPVPPSSPHLLSRGWGCSTQHMGRLQGSPQEIAQPQGLEPQCPKQGRTRCDSLRAEQGAGSACPPRTAPAPNASCTSAPRPKHGLPRSAGK